MNPSNPSRPHQATLSPLAAFLVEIVDDPLMAMMVAVNTALSILAVFMIGVIAYAVWGPVTRTPTKLERILSDCDWRGCSYQAFDGSHLYPISRLETLTLKAGQRVCVTTPALRQAKLAPGACPVNQGTVR